MFISERKAGLLAGWDWGHGFVLRHFPDGTWSAPCFLRLRYASLGLTLGAQSIQSVSVLQVGQRVWALLLKGGRAGLLKAFLYQAAMLAAPAL